MVQAQSNQAVEVPFFVLHLGRTKAKALFLVPPSFIEHLIQHPIVCRGSFFTLRRELEENVFVSTIYESYDIESTAAEMALRLRQRIKELYTLDIIVKHNHHNCRSNTPSETNGEGARSLQKRKYKKLLTTLNETGTILQEDPSNINSEDKTNLNSHAIWAEL